MKIVYLKEKEGGKIRFFNLSLLNWLTEYGAPFYFNETPAHLNKPIRKPGQ